MGGLFNAPGCPPPLSGRRFATIVLLGPFVGGIVYALVALSLAPELLGVADTVGLGLLIVIFGYALGFVPVLLAAIVWRFIPRPSRLLPRAALAALIGAFAGMGGISLLVAVSDLRWPDPGLFGLIGVCGAVALVVTAIPRSGGGQD